MLNDLHAFLLGQLTKSTMIERPGNIHNLIKENYDKPTAGSQVDFPALELVLINISGPLESTSSHKTFSLTYDIQLKSGSKNQADLNQLLWQLIQRVCYVNTNRGIFEYEATRPLTRVTFLETPIGLFANNTVAGFSSVSKLRVDIHVQNSLVIPPACDNI